MTKHMNTKHAEQKCNVCQKVFGTSIEVLQHVAKEHISDKDSNNYEGQGETSFVYSESMLDEFIEDKEGFLRYRQGDGRERPLMNVS